MENVNFLIHKSPSPESKGDVQILTQTEPVMRMDPKPSMRYLLPSVGITFGCFIPMHTGHMDLILRSRTCHDYTIVAVCGYDRDRGIDFIPFRKRIALTKQVFERMPDVTVVPVDDHKIGLTGTFSVDAWKVWCAELFAQCQRSPYDPVLYHWYSGEGSYLEKIRMIYPEHIFHQIDRSINPISGTKIRENWKQHQKDIQPLFLEYLEKRG